VKLKILTENSESSPFYLYLVTWFSSPFETRSWIDRPDETKGKHEMNAPNPQTPDITEPVAAGRRQRQPRAARWSSAAFGVGMTVTGLVLANTGPAAAVTLAGGPPLQAAQIDFGLMSVGAVSSLTTAFDARASGPVTITSPDPAVFDVVGVDTYTVTYEPVDPTGDLPAGHRAVRAFEPVYTLDQSVAGGGPVNVAQGERVVMRVAATAPAWTPPDGLEVELMVEDNGAKSTVPVSVDVSRVDYEISPGYFSVSEGGSVDVSLDIDVLSGPDTDVTLEIHQYQDIYGLSPLGMGVAYPTTVGVTQGHNFVTLHFQSTPGMLGVYDYLVQAAAFGTTQDLGSVVVDVRP
jgi:hypothetical protein